MDTMLVTGGNGFVGSNLIRRLLELGNCKVRVLVLPGSPMWMIEEFCSKIEVVYGDITRPGTLESAVRGVTVVYHLAALASDWGSRAKFMAVIYRGTRNVLLAAARAGVRRFVQMSSLAVHDFLGYRGATEETPRHNSKYFYGQAKNLTEDLVNLAHQKGLIETTIVRPGWVIFGENDTAMITQFLDNLRKGPFGQINHGKALCNLVYVQNLVEGVILAANHPAAAGETFIIADGTTTWGAFTRLLAKGLGVSPFIINVPYGAIAPIVWFWEKIYGLFRVKQAPLLTMYRIGIQRRDIDFSSAKVRDRLGYRPRFSLAEGLRRTIEWYKVWTTRGKELGA